MPPAPLGWREGSVMRHRLLRQQAVLGDDPRHELTQTSSIRRWETLPEGRSRRLLRRLGLRRVAGSMRGGPLEGLHIQLLLSDRRADVDTTEPALTRLIH